MHLQLGQDVSSEDAQVNDRVEFEVVDEVRVSGVVVINKGATAWGTVSEAQPKRRLARGGKLEIAMDSVQLTDGDTAELRATKDAQGGGHRVVMTAGMVATGVVFLPAAPIFLLMHGKNVTIPKGTEVPTFVNGNLELDPSKFQGFPMAASTPPPARNAEISVTSNPPNADILLDGAFVGNTPSTLMVSSGDHAIQIARSGYKTWERKMSVTSGKVAIAADLEAATSETATAAVSANSPQQK